jgi:hypothetical protein
VTEWHLFLKFSVAEIFRCFKATTATENTQFILTKLNEGVGLIKESKDTGAKEKESFKG